MKVTGKLSPKILVVAPAKGFFWQCHHRRAEIWRDIQGQSGVVRSNTDSENQLEILNVGTTITILQGEHHRLVDLEYYTVEAKKWQHTDVANFSVEEDIVRLQEDFGR